MNEKLRVLVTEYHENIKFMSALFKHLDDVRTKLEEGHKAILEEVETVREKGGKE